MIDFRVLRRRVNNKIYLWRINFIKINISAVLIDIVSCRYKNLIKYIEENKYNDF